MSDQFEPGPPAADGARAFVGRRALLIGVGIAVAGVGLGVGVALAASNATSPAAAPTVTAQSATSPSSGQAAKKGAHHAIRAAVISQSGATWTVRTKDGHTLSVAITADTQFGTKKAPAQASQFTPGSSVVIIGRASDDKVTATRIVGSAAGGSPTSPASPSASPS
ncbi:MAG: hypothetical protein ABJB98_07300 [Actinomycetota bacterium]